MGFTTKILICYQLTMPLADFNTNVEEFSSAKCVKVVAAKL